MGKERIPSKDLLPLTEEQHRIVRETMIYNVSQKPPTIGLIGVSGVGKSSTINTLFRTHLPVSDTVACTKEFENIDLKLSFTSSDLKDLPVQLRVIDAPGLGEDITLDPKYIHMYQENFPQCDVILWVLTARQRAVALDQRYLQEFPQFYERIVFGLNQVDLIEPLDWDEAINLPSDQQLSNVDIIVEDRQKRLEDIIQKKISLIPYSSRKGFNLQVLFTSILDSCPDERAWIFDQLKAFSYEQFIPAHLLEQITEEDNGNRLATKWNLFGSKKQDRK